MDNVEQVSEILTDRLVIIVDDEKNIRLTLSEVIRELGFAVLAAGNGETALKMLSDQDAWLVLLDLRLPDLDGMEVLRRARALGSEAAFVIITAHGTVTSAVDAMKRGAVDFLQKPFTPTQLRDIIWSILNREDAFSKASASYGDLAEGSIRAIRRKQYARALSLVERALRLDDTRPEAHNLRGMLYELEGDSFQAQQRYRRALSVDPTYEPARANLHHSVEPGAEGSFILQELKKERPRGDDIHKARSSLRER